MFVLNSVMLTCLSGILFASGGDREIRPVSDLISLESSKALYPTVYQPLLGDLDFTAKPFGF